MTNTNLESGILKTVQYGYDSNITLCPVKVELNKMNFCNLGEKYISS